MYEPGTPVVFRGRPAIVIVADERKPRIALGPTSPVFAVSAHELTPADLTDEHKAVLSHAQARGRLTGTPDP